MDKTLDSDRIYQTMIDAGNRWADDNAAADLLEEGKRSLLSQLSLTEDAKSVADAERKAMASHAYQEYIAGMVEARRKANRSRVAYDSIKALAELRRSEESTRRAEMRL